MSSFCFSLLVVSRRAGAEPRTLWLPEPQKSACQGSLLGSVVSRNLLRDAADLIVCHFESLS